MGLGRAGFDAEACRYYCLVMFVCLLHMQGFRFCMDQSWCWS